MFLTLNAEAFKKGLSAAGTGVRNMAGGANAAFSTTKARLQENLVAVKKYNAELQQQSGIVQGLKGHVTALVGAYLGFQSIIGVVGLLRSADSAAFSLEASLRAANREFTNIGNADSWTAAIGRMAGELRIYSKSELKTAVASTIDMTKRLGFSAEQMEVLIKRTADLSAGKTDLNGGIERVTAAMRGEAEASEYLGLTLNENYVKAWHEAHNAHNKAWKDLTDLEKAQIRFNVFLEQATPLTGKAADSVTTLSGAYALVGANILDAVEGNRNAVEATKQLSTFIAENADKIGELATILITAATATMQFVLNNKEAVAAVGLVVLGAGTLSFAISSLTTVWRALNVVMLATTGQQFGPWAASTVTAIKSVNLGAMTLKTTMGALAGLLLAWEAGKWFGGLIGQIDIVQTAMVGLIHKADQARLAAQKMWAQLTGSDADVKAIDDKIAISNTVYKEMLADIKAGKGAGEKKNTAPEKQPEAPENPKQSDTPDAQKKADVGYRTPEYLDQLDEAVLSPEELEDRKKRWAEREQQEKQLNDEKNTRLDDVAKANAEKDGKREKIRQADHNRKVDPNSSNYDREYAKNYAAKQRRIAAEKAAEEARKHPPQRQGEQQLSEVEPEEEPENDRETEAGKKSKKVISRSGGSAGASLISEEIKEIETERKAERKELFQGMATLDHIDQMNAQVDMAAASKYAAKASERKRQIFDALQSENERNRQAEEDAAAKGETVVTKRATATYDPAIAALEAAAKENELRAKQMKSGTLSAMAKSLANVEAERQAFAKGAEAKKAQIEADQVAAEKEYQTKLRLAELDKGLHEEAVKRNEDLAESAEQSAAARIKAEEDATGKAKSVFEKYAARVKELQDEIAGRERSLADELSDLDPHATEEQRWRRKAKAAADYEKAAKAAMAAGRLDEAREYADQAKTTYAGLKDGSGRISDKLAGRTAFSGVSSAGNLGLAISKMMTDAAGKAAKSGLMGIDGLNTRISSQLQKAMGALADAAPTGPGKQQAAQVHEIRLGNARLQGSPNDVADFIKQLELAGMRA